MKHSYSTARGFALAASLVASFAAPAYAVQPMVDPHILSAAPFQFRADSAILSRMTDTPSDSRIFMSPEKTTRSNDTRLSDERLETRTLL